MTLHTEQSQTNHDSPEKITIGFICLLFFMAGIIINPVNLFPALRPLRPQYLFAIFATIGLIFDLLTKSRKLNWTGIQTSYTLFMIATLLSLTNLKEYGLLTNGIDRFNNSLKTWLMVVLIGSFAARPRLFRICFNFFLFTVGMFQLHCLKAMFAGVTLVQGRFDSWVGQISNSDFIGTFFAVMVPIQLELFLAQKRFTNKVVFLAMVLASVFIMVKTQTRAAFLSLLVVIILWSMIRQAFKRRIKFCILLVAIFLIFASLTDTHTEYEGGFFTRMKTIFSSSAREEDSNIQGRFYLWKQGIQIWSKFPLLGCGIGGMDPHQTIDKDIGFTVGDSLTDTSLHQSFIQVLAERGTIGGITYGLFIFLIFRHLLRIKKWCREDHLPDHFMHIATGLQLGLIGFMIGSLFMSVEENWILIFFAGFASALYKCTQSVKDKSRTSIHTSVII